MKLRFSIAFASFLEAIASMSPAQAQVPAFDMAAGNVAEEVIGPAMIPAIADVSPGFNDVPFVMRYAALITNAWFDAIAPYHPTAVGVYSRLGRRPADESIDNTNMNVALCYASLEALRSLSPARTEYFRDVLESLGIDPDAESTDPGSPIHIGRSAGRAVIEHRLHDGMNQLGDEGGRRYNRQPYADYTGFIPSNTAKTDVLDHTIVQAPGSSFVEPGLTPASEVALHFPTWSDLESKCGSSRVWGGVHFEAAVLAGHEIGREVAPHAFEFVMRRIAGPALAAR